ncbi:Alpha/beta hydrolase fold protein [Bisporella sp. PMI_857]|nr:Alpha/beta hydrolase fold protein [Bisporella sp. PMI_857]
MMIEGHTTFDIPVEKDITIHGIKSGNGPPLLLLHGFPQSHHMWHLITPQLSPSFTIIAIDLRGYGASSKPPASPSHASYSKSTMARDCAAVMATLGYETFFVISHDRGARVAHKLCVDFPDRVRKCILLDICPTLTMYEKMSSRFAKIYWNWFFLAQPTPFPEKAITGNAELFAERFFYGHAERFIKAEAMQVYKAQLRDMEVVTAACEDYRAAGTVDLEEARKDLEDGKKARCPIRVLWGGKGATGTNFDVLAEWRAVSEGEVSGEPVGTGHWIPEEVPDVVVKHALEFFGDETE